MTERHQLSRRDFLAGSAAVGAAAVAGGIGGVALASVVAPAKMTASSAVPGYIPFDGAHQAGIVTPARPQTAAIFVALDAVISSKPELATTLADLTTQSRRLTGGLAPDAGDRVPAARERHRRPTVGPSDLTITFGRGQPFRRTVRVEQPGPQQLTRMPTFANDQLGAGRPTATCSYRSAPPTRRPASTPCAT